MNIKLDFKTVKTMFFDRKKIKSKVDARTRKVLSKFGAYVRQTAKRSLRYSSGTSEPGHPPFSHSGLLRKFIFFGYDPRKRSVVIGPVILPSKSGKALPALEYGGKTDLPSGTLIRIEARPFMGPAFRQELPMVSNLWRDAIGK